MEYYLQSLITASASSSRSNANNNNSNNNNKNFINSTNNNNNNNKISTKNNSNTITSDTITGITTVPVKPSTSISYELEYCTSSSSLSPPISDLISSHKTFGSSSGKAAAIRAKSKRYPSSSSTSSAESSPSSSPSAAFLRQSNMARPLSPHMCSSRYATKKRKRSSSINLHDKDPEIGCEPPLAKRQQRLPSSTTTAAAAEAVATSTSAMYHQHQHYASSDSGSVVSSTAYPSPNNDIVVNDMLSTNSSSPAAAIIDDMARYEELPEIPDSPLPDSPESPPSPDRGDAVVPHVIVRYRNGNEADNDDDDDDDDDVNDDDNDDNLHVVDDDDIDVSSDDTDDGFHANQIYEDEKKHNDYQHRHAYQQQQQHLLPHCGERTPGAQLNTAQQHSNNTVNMNNNNNNNNNKNNNNNNNNKKNNMSIVKTFDEYMADNYKCMTPAVDAIIESPQRSCPLPALSWANAGDVWRRMCKKDEQAACLRGIQMLDNHPGLQPRMRAILLDWLIEVCEVYKLHRETYYLAVDYLDRYLNASKKVQKTHLQLLGITCLFVAAKVEEIYPPKIGEFAYVTDGACTEEEILQHEKILLQLLDWQISPMSAMGWLGVYMQLNVNNRTPASLPSGLRNSNNNPQRKVNQQADDDKTCNITPLAAVADDAFIYPQFSGMEFVQTAQLLDLCSLDVGIANYPYSILAAAAMSFTFNPETALRCSGLEWQQIQPCALWMQPFFHVISEESVHLYLAEQNEQVTNKFGLGHICPNIVTDDSHIIQTHTITMDMFDRVLFRQQQIYAAKIKQEASPATSLIACPDGLLTPPASSRKPFEAVGSEVYYHDETDTTPQASVTTLVTTSTDCRENRENVAYSSCSSSNSNSSRQLSKRHGTPHD